MRTWFSRRPALVQGAEPVEAYREGRADERRRVETDGVGAGAAKGELDRAYERGRRDERSRHHGHPFITLLLVILSAAAIGIAYLAVHTGSFAAAGAVIDGYVSSTDQRATAPVRTVADKAGTALQNAGQSLKERAGAQQP